MSLRVVVLGAAGRMGQEVLRSLTAEHGFEVVGAVDVQRVGELASVVAAAPEATVAISNDGVGTIEATKPDVIVDFSHHSVVGAHALAAIGIGASPVIGATGLSLETVAAIRSAAEAKGVGAMIVPNFSIGAVLMMKFAEIAARWIPDVEVIELHHDRKEDAPSGTAMLTCERIGKARSKAKTELPATFEKVPGPRGGMAFDVPVHSVRLPGLLAHQEVLFGALGETLTIRHDSLSRTSFMEGVRLCCREAAKRPGLTIGMDGLLFGE